MDLFEDKINENKINLSTRIEEKIRDTVSQAFDGDLRGTKLSDEYTTPASYLLRLSNDDYKKCKEECRNVVTESLKSSVSINAEVSNTIKKTIDEKFDNALVLQLKQAAEIKNSLDIFFPDNRYITGDILDDVLMLARNAISNTEFMNSKSILAMNTRDADYFREKKSQVSNIVKKAFESFLNERNLNEFKEHLDVIDIASYGLSDVKQVMDANSFYNKIMVGDLEKYAKLCGNINEIFKSVTPSDYHIVYVR